MEGAQWSWLDGHSPGDFLMAEDCGSLFSRVECRRTAKVRSENCESSFLRAASGNLVMAENCRSLFFRVECRRTADPRIAKVYFFVLDASSSGGM